MTALLLQTIVLLAAMVILVRAEPALNRMGRSTPILIRASFHLLALGAAAQIVTILAGEVPSWPTAIVVVGAASLLVCERRLRVLCRGPQRVAR
ncbi:MAG: hypothetical protein AB1409_08265 [Pseudomonadota bacterium]